MTSVSRVFRTRFAPRPRDPRYEPKLWIWQLTDPPPFFREDDWNLIEHIRETGQLASGAIVNDDASIFDRGIYTASSLPAIDANASERNAAAAAAEIELRKRLREQRRLATEEAARIRERVEARKKLLMEQRAAEDAADREAARLKLERAAEKRRQDEEWEAAHPKEAKKRAAERKAEAERQQIADLRRREHEAWLLSQRSEQRYQEQRAQARQDEEWLTQIRAAQSRRTVNWPALLLDIGRRTGGFHDPSTSRIILIDDQNGTYRDRNGNVYYGKKHADGTFDLYDKNHRRI